VFLEPEAFTPDNGKLTPSVKLCRPFLERFYRNTIDSLVEEVALQSVENIDTRKIQQDRMKALVSEALGVSTNVSETSSFKAIGGDSLAAIRLIKLIKDKLNVDLPIGKHICSIFRLNRFQEQLYDETSTISALCNVIGSKTVAVKEDVTVDAVLEEDIVPE
jgi:acyl carrier protein